MTLADSSLPKPIAGEVYFLVGLEHVIFPHILTHIFQRGGSTTNQILVGGAGNQIMLVFKATNSIIFDEYLDRSTCWALTNKKECFYTKTGKPTVDIERSVLFFVRESWRFWRNDMSDSLKLKLYFFFRGFTYLQSWESCESGMLGSYEKGWPRIFATQMRAGTGAETLMILIKLILHMLKRKREID